MEQNIAQTMFRRHTFFTFFNCTPFKQPFSQFSCYIINMFFFLAVFHLSHVQELVVYIYINASEHV